MNPNLFIAGAPKCGTTSLHNYLDQHPQASFPGKKEPKFFGRDLYIKERLTKREYVELFSDISNVKYTGEGMVYKLYSRTAATEIKELFPESKIIIMLRNPVDFMYSMYFQNRYEGIESAKTFEKALAADASSNANGRIVDSQIDMPHRLQYRAMASFSSQVERYLETFGRENVLVLDFRVFSLEPKSAFAKVLSFLQLDSFEPNYEIVNASKRNRSATLRKLIASPPKWFSKCARVCLSDRTKISIQKTIKLLNTAPNRKKPIDKPTKERLLAEFQAEIDDIEKLTGIRF